jgi:hypothetical protein
MVQPLCDEPLAVRQMFKPVLVYDQTLARV